MAGEFYNPPSSYYNAPGAAASNAIQQFMVERQQQQRQAMIDQIAVRRQAQLEQYQAQEMQLRAQDLKERQEEQKARREDLIQRGIERKTADVEKRISGMLPGDVPDPEMLAQAQELGLGHNFPKQNVPAQTPLPGAVPPPAGAPAPSQIAPPQAPIRIAQAPNEPPLTEGLGTTTDTSTRAYIGNRQDREKNARDAQVKEISDRLALTTPDSPEWRQLAMQYEMLTNKAVQTKAPTPVKADQRRLIFDPIKNQYRDAAGKVVTDVSAADAIDRSAEPRAVKDTSTADEMRLQNVREHAYAEHREAYKKVNDQIDALDHLDTALNANSAAADGLIVPMLMKGTIAGGGVRITQPEIDGVLKARNAYDSMQVSLNKYFKQTPDANGKLPPLVLSNDQKLAIADLSKKLRTKAMAQHSKMNGARRTIDEATSVDAINRARTAYEEDRYNPGDAAAAAANEPLPPNVTVTLKRKP